MPASCRRASSDHSAVEPAVVDAAELGAAAGGRRQGGRRRARRRARRCPPSRGAGRGPRPLGEQRSRSPRARPARTARLGRAFGVAVPQPAATRWRAAVRPSASRPYTLTDERPVRRRGHRRARRRGGCIEAGVELVDVHAELLRAPAGCAPRPGVRPASRRRGAHRPQRAVRWRQRRPPPNPSALPRAPQPPPARTTAIDREWRNGRAEVGEAVENTAAVDVTQTRRERRRAVELEQTAEHLQPSSTTTSPAITATAAPMSAANRRSRTSEVRRRTTEMISSRPAHTSAPVATTRQIPSRKPGSDDSRSATASSSWVATRAKVPAMSRTRKLAMASATSVGRRARASPSGEANSCRPVGGCHNRRAVRM